eukprot:5866342-Prymnesium_polylepis.1
MTDVGMQEMVTNATYKQLCDSPQREEWPMSDERALQVQLRAGNKLVPVSKPRRLGQPLLSVVTARRIKVDTVTKRLQ